MSNQKHSSLGPSGAERWINCPGSVALSAKQPPDRGNIYSATGTVAHKIAEDFVTGKADYFSLIARIGEIEKTKNGFEVEITEEMLDGAVLYKSTIDEDLKLLMIKPKGKKIITKSESTVHASSVDDEVWGRCDYMIYRKGDELIIYDYKFGKKIHEPDENYQATLYAIGAMDSEAGYAYDKITLKIIQPRAPHVDGPVRDWVAPNKWITEFKVRAADAAKASRLPNAKIEEGPWCDWCRALPVCPAQHAKAQAIAKVDFSAVSQPVVAQLPPVHEMSVEKMMAALAWKDVMTKWFSSMEARGTEMLEAGQAVPGKKLVYGRSNRKLKSAEEIEAALGPLLGGTATLYTDPKLKGLTELEKLVGKKKFGKLNLTTKPTPPKVMADADDARPEVPRSAQSDFGPVVNGAAVVDPLAPPVGAT